MSVLEGSHGRQAATRPRQIHHTNEEVRLAPGVLGSPDVSRYQSTLEAVVLLAVQVVGAEPLSKETHVGGLPLLVREHVCNRDSHRAVEHEGHLVISKRYGLGPSQTAKRG
jgi:hypothetical protein